MISVQINENFDIGSEQTPDEDLKKGAWALGLLLPNRLYRFFSAFFRLQACELILKPREGEVTFMKQIREHWWKYRDPAAALKFFYKTTYGVEAKLLSGLARHGSNDYVNSLNDVSLSVSGS